MLKSLLSNRAFQSCCQPISRHVRKYFPANMAFNMNLSEQPRSLVCLIAQGEWSKGGHVCCCAKAYGPTNYCDIYFSNRNALWEFYVRGRRTVDPKLKEAVIFQRTRIMLAHWGRGDTMAATLQTTFSTVWKSLYMIRISLTFVS